PKDVTDATIMFLDKLPKREFKLSSRKYTLFACLHMAYMYLKLPLTLIQLGIICSFTPEDITKGISEYRRLYISTKVNRSVEAPTVSVTSPLTLLYIYCLQYFINYPENIKTPYIKHFLDY